LVSKGKTREWAKTSHLHKKNTNSGYLIRCSEEENPGEVCRPVKQGRKRNRRRKFAAWGGGMPEQGRTLTSDGYSSARRKRNRREVDGVIEGWRGTERERGKGHRKEKKGLSDQAKSGQRGKKGRATGENSNK